MTAALLSGPVPHGAVELQRAARSNMVRALALSSLLGLLTFALAWLLSSLPAFSPGTKVRDTRVVSIFEVPPPPALRLEKPPQSVPASASVPAAATPVPVLETLVAEERTPMAAEEWAQVDGGAVPGAGSPSSAGISASAAEEVVNLPNTPPLVDKLPEPIRRVEPRYPDIAQQAQIEGLVLVNVLVSKDGRVQEALLHPKVHVPMLDPAALEAARQWTFEPALLNGRPVAVWVAVPFRFHLR